MGADAAPLAASASRAAEPRERPLAPTRSDRQLHLPGARRRCGRCARDGERRDAWRRRAARAPHAYIQKAMREAKVSTSWTDPDAAYEAAIRGSSAQLLDRRPMRTCCARSSSSSAAIAPQAMWNALAALAMHLTAPGVPDIYRGDELWFPALVDPDNRAAGGLARASRRVAPWHDVGGDATSLRELRCMARRDRMDANQAANARHALLWLPRAQRRYDARQRDMTSSWSERSTGGSRVCLSPRFRGPASSWSSSPRLTRRIAMTPVGPVWGDTCVVGPQAHARRGAALIPGEQVGRGGCASLEASARLPFQRCPCRSRRMPASNRSKVAITRLGGADCQTGLLRVRSCVRDGLEHPREGAPESACHTARGNS